MGILNTDPAAFKLRINTWLYTKTDDEVLEVGTLCRDELLRRAHYAREHAHPALADAIEVNAYVLYKEVAAT